VLTSAHTQIKPEQTPVRRCGSRPQLILSVRIFSGINLNRKLARVTVGGAFLFVSGAGISVADKTRSGLLWTFANR
jgi:hypothetical protein